MEQTSNQPWKSEPQGSEARESSLRQMCHINYALYVASFFVGITAIIALVLAYIKLDDARGTYYEQQFRWQINTFWIGLVALIGLTVVGFVLTVATLGLGFFLVGFLGFVWFIWVVYRIVKGWIYLSDNKPL
ncbi:DUF4870 family protein [Microbulbifer celer]|uniref:DUF4870 family protein n=1 Tax=Microbulbifer celer TaxID=435905 RepID=A0ABW3UAW1_9GAMM|nr:hypothetical protein [Microbulbifer celer]UFN57239.1 hypothetical protein LPW13_16980 [Microbulbifer celer]